MLRRDPDDTTAYTMRAALLLRDAFESGDSARLDLAIEAGRRAVAACRPDEPNLPTALSNLGVGLVRRFEASKQVGDIDQGIAALESAVEQASLRDLDSTEYLYFASDASRVRFEHTRTPEHLDHWLGVSKRAFKLVRGGHQRRHSVIELYLFAVSTRWSITHAVEELDELIAGNEQALAEAGDDLRIQAFYVSRLVSAFSARYEQTASGADIELAVSFAERAVALIAADDPVRLGHMWQLATALSKRHALRPAEEDLDHAIEVAEQVIADTAVDAAELPGRLGVLAELRYRRFDERSEEADLDEAISVGNEAVRFSARDDRDLPARLTNMGIAYRRRYETLGAEHDLDDGIRIGKLAVEAAQRLGGIGLGVALRQLGRSLTVRFEKLRDQRDLDEAINAISQAINTISEALYAIVDADEGDGLDTAKMLRSALRQRADLTSSFDDFDRAVAGSEIIVELTPDESNHGALVELALDLSRRHDARGGDGGDLDRAITLLTEAMDTANLGDEERAGYAQNLGKTLCRRFEWRGTLSDLHRAVDVLRQSAALTPLGDSSRCDRMAILSMALTLRFTRLGSQTDLDDAVAAAHAGFNDAEPLDPNRRNPLLNLSTALWNRYKLTGAVEDSERAVEAAEEAVALTPAGPDLAESLGVAGIGLLRLFHRTRAQATLDRSIGHLEQALNTSHVEVNRLAYRHNLIIALADRYPLTQSEADLRRAADLARETLESERASPWMRVSAAAALGDLAAEQGKWLEAVEGYTQAVTELPLIAPRDLTRSDQEHRLRSISGVGSRAAVACLQAGLSEASVELWEYGRAVLLGQMLETRTDLTQLDEEHPVFASRFREARDKLEVPDIRVDRLEDGQAQASVDRQAVSDFSLLLGEIRALEGFSEFLRPAPFRTLVRCSEKAPVVIINVAERRSDAIILQTPQATVLPLPALSPDRLQAWVSTLVRTTHDVSSTNQKERERSIENVLAWLWDSIAEPVLRALGITKRVAADEVPPRICWCPGGLLSFLPLHAAGRHGTRFSDSPETVLDRAASSYLPTLRSMLDRVHGASPDPNSDWANTLVVAMPQTPAAGDLPGVLLEVDRVTKTLGINQAPLVGPEATYDTVTNQLIRRARVHFACHGATDPVSPSASYLLLHDHQTRPLTVLDISRMRLEMAELAFLSACSTARTVSDMPDEAIHLASAFQLAGYRHVIATLWSIDDQVAAEFADDFYRRLASQRVAIRSDDEVFKALHFSSIRLRDRYADSPSLWASHVHYGA